MEFPKLLVGASNDSCYKVCELNSRTNYEEYHTMIANLNNLSFQNVISFLCIYKVASVYNCQMDIKRHTMM